MRSSHLQHKLDGTEMLCLQIAVQAGVIAAPDVEVRQLDHTYKFLVIMSDGIWENVSASKICQVHIFSNKLQAHPLGLQELEGSEGRTSKACSKILDEVMSQCDKPPSQC